MEQKIYRLCEKCYKVILKAEVALLEATYGERSLSPLQREKIYQTYRDLAVSQSPGAFWLDVYEAFDRIYKEVEASHKNDANAVA